MSEKPPRKPKSTEPQIFLVSNPATPARLIRAVSAAAARSHLFGETVIVKASGNDVANVLEGGGHIEDANAQAQEAAQDGEKNWHNPSA